MAVVINHFNTEAYLAAAIRSTLRQTVPPREIIVVDDGSAADPSLVLKQFQGVRLIRQENAGLAAARNAGLARATSDFILFLDADDLLEPHAIEAGLACHAASPGAAMVYGGHRRIAADGTPLGPDRFAAVSPHPYRDLLRGNCVAMHGTALYRRDVLRDAGGFDAGLRRCEDYDLYLRLARDHPIGCHPNTVAEYRWHGGNMSRDTGAMLRTVLSVHARHAGGDDPDLRQAWREGRENWLGYYADEIRRALTWKTPGDTARSVRQVAQLFLASPGWLAARVATSVKRAVRRMPRLGRSGNWPPALGKVRFGDLGSTSPVSMVFGFDRGLPIDRHYVEDFLRRHAADIHGRVLEIGDDSYSRRFGGDAIARQDVLHVSEGNPAATMVGDLTDASVVPDDSFDCMIVTQTLHLIYDVHAAARRIHAALRPGGVLLLTVPGISQIDRGDWRPTWYWGFTSMSITRIFAEVFGEDAITVTHYGNVFAATAFLHGLAVSEVERAKLDVVDDSYQVIIAVRARKAA